MAVNLETELYPPVKSFFTNRGFEVKAEIRGCDLIAVRADQDRPCIVEMKKTFTLPLLLQGVDRQKTEAVVWLAVERNRAKKGAHNQRFAEIAALCRRLNLGFMTVTFYRTKSPVVEVWCEPAITEPHPSAARFGRSDAVRTSETVETSAGGRRKAKAAKLMQEFHARSGDYNVGGSTKRKLVTAYREKAIQCAIALYCHGPSAPRQVRNWTHCPTAASLLQSNYYGWFKRVAKGVYELTPIGKNELMDYKDVTKAWARRFAWATGFQEELERESIRNGATTS